MTKDLIDQILKDIGLERIEFDPETDDSDVHPCHSIPT